MKKKGLIFLSIIVLILLIIGIGMLNKRLKSKEENNNSHTPVKTTEYNLKLIKTVICFVPLLIQLFIKILI